jgi:aspartate/methionine/tyrosine aminotransferase
LWSEAVIKSVLDICSRHDLYLIADECYDAIVFEGVHVSPASLDEQGRTISVFSLSKTYAMTGWRVGYVTAAPTILDQVGKVVENSVSCAAAVSQKAAEAALRGDQACVDEMVNTYRQRRDLALLHLKRTGLTAWAPQGAFYVMVSVPVNDTMDFAHRLASEAAVTVAPGETFGLQGKGMVRLSLASDASTIEEGIHRLAIFSRAEARKSPRP